MQEHYQIQFSNFHILFSFISWVKATLFHELNNALNFCLGRLIELKDGA